MGHFIETDFDFAGVGEFNDGEAVIFIFNRNLKRFDGRCQYAGLVGC